LIRLSDLGDDHWDYQERSHCIVGARTGAVLSLGQPLKVRIATVHVDGRHLDLVPVQSLTQGSPRKRSPSKKSRQRTKHAPRGRNRRARHR
jgi:ribonuclease R